MLTHDLFNTTPGLIHHDYGPPPGKPNAPTLLYLPGVQGDWTPLMPISRLLAEHFRLIATCYPRRKNWTLKDHAIAAETLLDELNIPHAHVLAESFGSIVGWTFALRTPERLQSLVIAGGFCQSPQPIGARFARAVCNCVSPHFLDDMVKMYVHWLAGERLRGHGLHDDHLFLAIRSKPGWHTCANRMRLIYKTDLRHRLGEIRLPVGYIGGAGDKVVPVHREVKTLKETLHPDCRLRTKLWPGTPHAILPAKPQECTEWLKQWVSDVDAHPAAAH